jgi:hypothetical protein
MLRDGRLLDLTMWDWWVLLVGVLWAGALTQLF